MTSKASLTERDITTKYIIPSLTAAGWNLDTQIREEVYFTDGRIYVKGDLHARGKRKRADIILYYKPNLPVAIIEVKDNTHTVGAGMQQGLKYAEILDIPVVYSTNGDSYLEHNRGAADSSIEREVSLEGFPSPEELWKQYKRSRKIETDEAEEIAQYEYHYDALGYSPRYYQRVAINRTVEAIAKGQNRVLLVMATGTGKTYTAFQIIYRLWKSGAKKRVLFLADRNALIDQTKRGDFKHFRDKMTIVRNRKIDKAFEVYLALYQGLTGYDEDKDAYREFSPDFFDLIIVDECHRGSAADDSAWRTILEYFSAATQIGMTATPRETKEISNIDYFGAPIYTYSLKQGIEDGFLAPYKVLRIGLNVDLEGWRPEAGKKDKAGTEVEDRLYNTKDFDKNIVIDERTLLVAKKVTEFLKKSDRFSKTIVFCVDIDHAERMRQALIRENADLFNENEKYIMRITGDSPEGKGEIDNFIDVESRYPVIATTSKLMTTGVDAKTCKLIVLDSNINSMTEFKQIIGRGTRVREDYGKMSFTIMDFRNVTDLFADSDFDGDPVMIKVIGGDDEIPDDEPVPAGTSIVPPEDTPYSSSESGDRQEGGPSIVDGGDIVKDPAKKIYVAGVDVSVLHERVQYLDGEGKLITESLIDYTKTKILSEFRTLDEFLSKWNSAEKKKAILDELEEHDIILDNLRKDVKKDLDLFDLICHIAWGTPALTRKERAEQVRKRNYFTKYGDKARGVIDALLQKYAEEGIEDIEDPKVLGLDPFSRMGRPMEIVNIFGGIDGFRKVVRELEDEIYRIA